MAKVTKRAMSTKPTCRADSHNFFILVKNYCKLCWKKCCPFSAKASPSFHLSPAHTWLINVQKRRKQSVQVGFDNVLQRDLQSIC
jgi:hypothetical protein